MAGESLLFIDAHLSWASFHLGSWSIKASMTCTEIPLSEQQADYHHPTGFLFRAGLAFWQIGGDMFLCVCVCVCLHS